jgi:hypothetical protein
MDASQTRSQMGTEQDEENDICPHGAQISVKQPPQPLAHANQAFIVRIRKFGPEDKKEEIGDAVQPAARAGIIKPLLEHLGEAGKHKPPENGQE